MTDPPADSPDHRPSRWAARVVEGSPRGGLHELEIRTRYQVIDRESGAVLLEYVGDYEASWSTDGSGWGDARTTGAVDLAIAPDGRSAVVRYADGREETVDLPE